MTQDFQFVALDFIPDLIVYYEYRELFENYNKPCKRNLWGDPNFYEWCSDYIDKLAEGESSCLIFVQSKTLLHMRVNIKLTYEFGKIH